MTWSDVTETATATVTAHGYSTDDMVSIAGADQPEYNGRFQITVVTADTFSYTVSSSATTPATGSNIQVHLLGDDQIKTTYDRLGRTVTTTDQRGVEHTYTYDSAGRLAADTATIPDPSDVDDAILRIGRTYDDIGRLETVTSYSDTAGTSAVNEVEYVYNGWGQLSREYQEHDGVVDGNTLFVDYTYDDAAVGGIAKYVRRTELEYPNGRHVIYNYGTAGEAGDRLSRIYSIGDGTDAHAVYTYLGAGTVVTEDYDVPEVRLDYTGTANSYSGFDRFGRVVDQLWHDYGNTEDADRFKYGYDRVGNRLWKENDVAANLGTPVDLDELYDYDDLYQLDGTERGELTFDDPNPGDVTITDKVFAQDWTLDGLGNWAEFDEDVGGDGFELQQTRAHDAANQTGTIAGTGTNWADSAHDDAGNMTTMPQPGSLASAYYVKYDAWNRLAGVYTDSNHTTAVAEYEYDGTGRRIEKVVEDTPDVNTHFFHTGNQVIETREDTGTAAPEDMQPKYQNVWSPRYIDSLILRDENTETNGLCDDDRLFYLADANYNVTAVVAETSPDTWEVDERYVYTPYGEVTIYDDDWSDTRSSSDYDNVTLYTGREYDVETGLYYYRARYYHAQLGRFINRDPIGYEGDTNLYEYVGNHPTNTTDPTGQAEQPALRDFYKNGTSGLEGPKDFKSSDGIVTGKYWVDGSLTAGPPDLKSLFPDQKTWKVWVQAAPGGQQNPIFNPRHLGAYVIAFDKDAGKNDPDGKGVRVWISFFYISTRTLNGKEAEARSKGWKFDSIWVGTKKPYVDAPGDVVASPRADGTLGGLTFNTLGSYAVGIACMNKNNQKQFLKVPLEGMFLFSSSDMLDASDPAKLKTAARVDWGAQFASASQSVLHGDDSLKNTWWKIFQAKFPSVQMVDKFK